MRVARMPHLDKHKGLWRVRIVVPPRLQEHVGRLTGKPSPIKVLLRSTGTGSRDEANRMALPIIAEFKALLSRAEDELRGEEVHHYTQYRDPAFTFGSGVRLVLWHGPEPAPDDPFWLTHTRPDGTRPEGAGKSTTASEFCAFRTIYEKWQKEQKPVAKTVYSWKRILSKLVAHIGNVPSVTEGELMRWNAASLTEQQVISWKDALVAHELHPTTIENHLTILRTIYNYAKANKLVPANAVEAAGAVKYKAKRRPGTKSRGFTDDEARTILLAARQHPDPVCRWSPWLAAHLGARIDEICGAMVADIETIKGVPCFHIRLDNRENDPDQEAEIKNENAERIVPLHAALIAEGFLDYVAKLPENGPLFPDLKPDRFGRRGGNGQKRISRWIRDKVQITDPRTRPNHAWRHRFRTLLRNPALQIGEDVVDYLCGHSGNRGEGRNYGGYAEAAVTAITKLPSPLSNGM
jgi:integrase